MKRKFAFFLRVTQKKKILELYPHHLTNYSSCKGINQEFRIFSLLNSCILFYVHFIRESQNCKFFCG
jgi:hypothetical protein